MEMSCFSTSFLGSHQRMEPACPGQEQCLVAGVGTHLGYRLLGAGTEAGGLLEQHRSSRGGGRERNGPGCFPTALST